MTRTTITLAGVGTPLTTQQQEMFDAWTAMQPGARGPLNAYLKMVNVQGPITVARYASSRRRTTRSSRVTSRGSRNARGHAVLLEPGQRTIELLPPPRLSCEPVRTFRGNQTGIPVVRCGNALDVPLEAIMSSAETKELRRIITAAGLTSNEARNCSIAYESLRAADGPVFMYELDEALYGKRAAKAAIDALIAMGLVERTTNRGPVLTIYSPLFRFLDRDLRYDLRQQVATAQTTVGAERDNVPARRLLNMYVAIQERLGHPASASSAFKLLPVAQRLVAGESFEAVRASLALFLLNPETFEDRIGPELKRYGCTLLTFERQLNTILDECRQVASAYKTNPDRWWKGPMEKAGLGEYCDA